MADFINFGSTDPNFVKAPAARANGQKDVTMDLVPRAPGQEMPKTELGGDMGLYSPLPSPRHIRILEIGPINEQDTDLTTYEYRMETRSLDDVREKYEALSYVWGSENQRVPERVNGHEVMVPRNLHDALPVLSRFTTFVWVDSICINQDDVGERGHQVKLMKDIYQYARSVLVWLGGLPGHETGDGLRAFTLRQYVAVWYRKGGSWLSRFACDRDMDQLQRNSSTHCPPYSDLTIVPGSNTARLVEELLSRPWFTRTWVVQEVAVARRTTVVFGKQSLPWGVFVGLCSLAERRKMESVPALKMVSLVKIIRDGGLDNRPLMSALLSGTRLLNASDPRDKVFAMLGICDRAEEFTQFPDYEMSVAAVYSAVTRSIIEQSQSLEILAHVSRISEMDSQDLPSWVPDWRVTPALPILGRSHRFTDMATTTNTARPFASTLQTCPVLGCQTDSSRIVLQGFAVGHITCLNKDLWLDRLAPYRKQREAFGTALKDFLVSHTNLFQQVENPVWSWNDDSFPPKTDSTCRFSIGHRVFMAYLKTILAGGCFADNQYIENTKSLVWKAVDRFWPPYSASGMVIIEDNFEYQHQRERHLMMTHARHTRQNRVLFTTDRYGLGICPKWAQVGDTICLLTGGKVPYVLRADSEGTYQLVGECYLLEAMQGELMRETERVGFEYTKFELV